MTTATGEPTAEVAVVAPAPKPRWWTRRRRFLAGLAVVLVSGAAVGTWLWLGTGGPKGSPSSPSGHNGHIAVLVAATTGTITDAINAHGTIQPAQVADLSFAVSGRVSAVDVILGQSVTVGQVLATVAPTALQATKASDQAALAQAQAKVAQDQATKAPASQLTADQAAVVSAQAALTTATTSLAEAGLTSPITGTVSTLTLTVGQQVSGTGTPGAASPGATLPPPPQTTGTPPPPADQVTVVSADQFVVATTVDDTEVGKVKVGDHVMISQTTGSGSGKTASGSGLRGMVAAVGMVPSTGTGVPTFPVTVDVTGTPSGVYAGSSARLSIVVSQITGAVEVPTPAITYRRGGPVVTVAEPGGGRRVRPVVVGATSGGMTQITRGLAAGQKVVERVETVPGQGAAGSSNSNANGGTAGTAGSPRGKPGT